MDSMDRAIHIANYIIEQDTTVRYAASVFGISKSTVHKDVSYRLQSINFALYQKVQKVLQHNLSVRHLRGGEATRCKYNHTKTQHLF
ncbi:MAG: sporulation transcriptional regulator SpoIIID [Firmicutes bacterium]|nr:sporulation transcriptional regulator SpoIIID [Bacillota bacterium]